MMAFQDLLHSMKSFDRVPTRQTWSGTVTPATWYLSGWFGKVVARLKWVEWVSHSVSRGRVWGRGWWRRIRGQRWVQSWKLLSICTIDSIWLTCLGGGILIRIMRPYVNNPSVTIGMFKARDSNDRSAKVHKQTMADNGSAQESERNFFLYK